MVMSSRCRDDDDHDDDDDDDGGGDDDDDGDDGGGGGDETDQHLPWNSWLSKTEDPRKHALNIRQAVLTHCF